jgi:PleD family two-component response regulator
VTVSVGVAELTESMLDGAAFMDVAEEALAQAKKAGKNRVQA